MTVKEKRIWNAAIDAAVNRLKASFAAPEVVIEIINQVRR